ncbi:MAG: class I SAM-dependent methyltransferase [Desulfamplus sp.]|nr:class I SAM-dependent methyltransferase [Desulfamplus sp.]
MMAENSSFHLSAVKSPNVAEVRPNKQVTDNELLYRFLAQDSSRQTSSLRMVRSLLREIHRNVNSCPLTVLDFGCGTGQSFEVLSGEGVPINWVGIDLLMSPEVNARKVGVGQLLAFDGRQVPIHNNCVDIVYSHQVFEHVRNPVAVLAEIERILKPGGVFVGSTSHLEPYHSRSLFNYTPYGFAKLLEDSGFFDISLRVGIDGITLIIRRLIGFLKFRILNWAFEYESPLNAAFELLGWFFNWEIKRRLAIKLLFSGHFVFSARKEDV